MFINEIILKGLMKISLKSLVFGSLVLLLIVGFIGSINAITGSIGNGRMVLRAETGDKLEKYVEVININDVDIDIELSASGDLADYIEIEDNKFSLEPGEEKNAYFTIDVRKSGTTESKINVKFIPKDGKNVVGLSSVVTVIAEGEDLEDKNILDAFKDGGGNVIDNVLGREDKISTTGRAIAESKKTGIIAIAFSITGAVLLILLVVVILYYVDKKRKIKPKKRVRKR